MDTGDELDFRTDDFHPNCFSAFAAMRENGEHCDVTIKAGRELLKAHRVVLASAIPYFKAIFTGNTKETTGNVISMKDSDPTALKLVLDFAYNNYLRIERDNVCSLLRTSMCLQLDCVTQACIQFVKETISTNNVFWSRNLATSISNADLLEHCDGYIRAHFDDVSSSKGFLELPFVALKEIIARDDLNAQNEENVFESVVRWVKASPAEREHHLPELLRNIRMTLISPEYLADRVSAEELVRRSHTCRDIVDEAKNCLLLSRDRLRSCSFITTERWCREQHHLKSARLMGFGLYLYYPVRLKFRIRYFDPIGKKWNRLLFKNHIECANNVLCSDRNIYFIGSTRFQTLDLQTLECASTNVTFRLPMGAGTALLGNKIYFIGGGSLGANETKAVSYLDTETATWVYECDMRRNRSRPCAVACGDDIFVIGGWNATDGFVSLGERFDPVTKQTSDISPLRTNREGFSCAALKGKIYACGGFIVRDGLRVPVSTCEVYDTLTDQWNSVCNMNGVTSNLSPGSLFSFRSNLCVITRSRQKVNLFNFDTYDPIQNKWKRGEPETSSLGLNPSFNVVFRG